MTGQGPIKNDLLSGEDVINWLTLVLVTVELCLSTLAGNFGGDFALVPLRCIQIVQYASRHLNIL